MKILTLAVIVVTLLLTGCSYSPARLSPQPLIEIDGYNEHRHYRGNYRDHDRYRHHRRHDYRERRHHGRHHHGQRRGFCPPGLARQGRC